ncbi:thiamine pyrophosphate-binding protein, partial [Saccharothrix carnea]|uniref:thiamine pyrophosphate-binding protein n=1 Tax=Saccharothrix carnea TaxID=1280637 RepID=UPI00363C049A
MRAVVEVLKSEGIDTVLGCPGAAILPLYKAMEEVDRSRLVFRRSKSVIAGKGVANARRDHAVACR